MAKLELLCWQIRRDPQARNYTDLAISPAAQDADRLFELYQRKEDPKHSPAAVGALESVGS